MKINKLVSQLLGIRLARLGFTGIIALLSWSLIISKAEAGVKAGKQGTQPPTAKNKRGSGQGIEGSNVFGDGAEIFFSNFSIEDNSNLPGNVISNGDGSLLDLVNTAADVWTQALPEFEDIQINIAWADFGLVPLAESETLGSTEEVRKERADLVENFQFNSFDNRLLLTSTINQSIEDALTHDDSETDEFILTAGSGLLGEFTTNSEEEIDEFEETFISIRPDNTEPDNIEPGSTEIDSLAAIFIPTIFEADKTTDHGDQFPSAGTIIFNSQDLVFDLNGDGIDETIKFFLDDNPLDSKVFGSATQFKERDGTDSLAGINIGRSSFAENNQFPLEAEDENVLVVDLFSVVLHELQHALGTTRVNSEATDNDSFKEGENGENGEIVTNDGNRIPTNFEPFVHIDLPTSSSDNPTPVGLETVTFGERKCLSAVDVLAVGEVGFNRGQSEGGLSLNPCRDLAPPKSVPESSNIVPLLIFGSGGLLVALQQGARGKSWKTKI